MLPKMPTLALAHEIAHVRVFEFQELSFDYDNSFRSSIQGLTLD